MDGEVHDRTTLTGNLSSRTSYLLISEQLAWLVCWL